MDPSTLAGNGKAAKPPAWWILVVLVAGAAGALGTIAAAGSGSYEVGPFQVRLDARPAPAGKTELAIEPAQLRPGFAEAGTHAGPIAFRATVTGIAPAFDGSDAALLATPDRAATWLRDEGKDAARAFGIKLLALSAAGGAAAGLLLSFGRWRRVLGGAAAGLLTMAIIGVVVGQTYDRTEFARTSWRFEQQRDGAPGVGELLPS